MRGDRPRSGTSPNRSGWATPHARGSTADDVKHVLRADGYPACAGIDRILKDYQRVNVRLPRMRGDRPSPGTYRHPARVATPHARGSTSPEIRRLRSGIGYPACAGIDLNRSTIRLGRRWLPRMRGDRPAGGGDHVMRRKATPHARGSTREFAKLMAFLTGYPACAGIDPNLSHIPSRIIGYPACAGIDPHPPPS